MAVFNSLGSNYKIGFALKSLFNLPSSDAKKRLQNLLAEKYKGQATLTYKGRQALEMALRLSNLPAGSQVGINSFTCYVVYEAVEKAGYEPIFIDLAEGQLNFGLKEMKVAAEKNPQLKAVVIQNTLGVPAGMVELTSYCDAKGILIIEDLAHSFGAAYSNGIEAGMVGQYAMFSFSQDKPLDVVAGGALVDRSGKQPETINRNVGFLTRLKNRFYPALTYKIRKTYPMKLGRYFHALLKSLKLMSTPMSPDVKGINDMTNQAASLLVKRWQTKDAEQAHRREIAAIYQNLLPKELQFREPDNSRATWLRFPLVVEDRAGLVASLKRHKIYIGDTWYDAPIGPKRYLGMTNYSRGLCPRAERIAETIVNLPTHINVDKKTAEFIAEKVNQWLESQ